MSRRFTPRREYVHHVRWSLVRSALTYHQVRVQRPLEEILMAGGHFVGQLGARTPTRLAACCRAAM
jgi:hypothetical protein